MSNANRFERRLAARKLGKKRSKQMSDTPTTEIVSTKKEQTELKMQALGAKTREVADKAGSALGTAAAVVVLTPPLLIAGLTEFVGYASGANVHAFWRGFARGKNAYESVRTDGPKALLNVGTVAQAEA